jgi:hypothetical protein
MRSWKSLSLQMMMHTAISAHPISLYFRLNTNIKGEMERYLLAIKKIIYRHYQQLLYFNLVQEKPGFHQHVERQEAKPKRASQVDSPDPCLAFITISGTRDIPDTYEGHSYINC